MKKVAEGLSLVQWTVKFAVWASALVARVAVSTLCADAASGGKIVILTELAYSINS